MQKGLRAGYWINRFLYTPSIIIKVKDYRINVRLTRSGHITESEPYEFLTFMHSNDA